MLCAFFTRSVMEFIISKQSGLPYPVLPYFVKTDFDSLIAHCKKTVMMFLPTVKHDAEQMRIRIFKVIDKFDRPLAAVDVFPKRFKADFAADRKKSSAKKTDRLTDRKRFEHKISEQDLCPARSDRLSDRVQTVILQKPDAVRKKKCETVCVRFNF